MGETYLGLANRGARLDVSGCSPVVKRHLLRADRINTEIAEFFAQGGLSHLKGSDRHPQVFRVVGD